MPAKYSNIDAGGVSFQITQTEKRELKTMIEEMKKLKTLYEAQLKVRERIGTLQKQVTSGQRLETQYHRDRLKTLESIFNRMKQINQVSLETLKRENPAVGLAWGRKGTSMGRYDYTPEAAGEVSGATRKKELTNSQKLVGVYNTLKKSYAWQLLYFSSVSILMAGMLSNSEVFAHFMDIIGSALGFIMDMLLVSVIPWVVKLVKFLFDVGAEVAKWPDWIKQIIVGLGLLVIGLLAIKVYTAITETIAAIKAIGAAAKLASGAEGVGALTKALAALKSIGLISIILDIIPTVFAMWLINELFGQRATGLEQRMKNGVFETRVGAYGQGAEEGWAPGGLEGIDYTRGQSGPSGKWEQNTTPVNVNVYIGNEQLKGYIKTTQTENQRYMGMPIHQ